MKKLNPGSVALILGTTFGLIHLLWSVAVMVGVAQWYLDFILSLHFINNPFTVQPFSIGNAVLLVAITFVAGYLIGWVFAAIWNMMVKK